MKSIGLAMSFAFALAVPAAAATYDLAGQFGSTNPAGPWTYGYFAPGATSGTLFPKYTSGSPATWTDPSLSQTAVYGTPSDVANTTGAQIAFSTVTLLAGQAAFHPGQNGEISYYEFTAPTAGAYALSASFGGRDYIGPTDTQVLITDGAAVPVFTGTVSGYAGDSGRAAFGASPTVSYAGTLDLTAGQDVFFEVAFDPAGTRGSGPFYYDTTSAAATLTTAAPTPAPEPFSSAVVASGLAGLALVRRRA